MRRTCGLWSVSPTVPAEGCACGIRTVLQERQNLANDGQSKYLRPYACIFLMASLQLGVQGGSNEQGFPQHLADAGVHCRSRRCALVALCRAGKARRSVGDRTMRRTLTFVRMRIRPKGQTLRRRCKVIRRVRHSWERALHARCDHAASVQADQHRHGTSSSNGLKAPTASACTISSTPA